MKTIPLSKGKYAIVDDEDYEELTKHKWCTRKQGRTFYAVRNIPTGSGKWRVIKMHSTILGTLPGQEVDHVNGEGLDNRKSNLRFCTHAQNCMNQRPPQGCSSVYKGVHWHKSGGKWRAQIRLAGRRYHLGYFTDEIAAARAYDSAAMKYFGEFARLNLPRVEPRVAVEE